MSARTTLARAGAALAALLLVAAVVALGPQAFRRERVRFAWAGSFGEGRLEEPIGIAYGDGRLWVSDATADRVVVFDTAGALLTELAGPELDLKRPMHLSRAPNGGVYVAEYLSDRITVLGGGGELAARLGGVAGSGPGELDAPAGVAVRRDTAFVADFYNHRVGLFGRAGPLPGALGRPGRVWGGRLHYPTDVAAGDSLVYVADAYNHRIQVFRPDGTPARRWGGPFGLGVPGPLRGWFVVATGIGLGPGTLHVADFYNDRIQTFTREGRFLGQFADSLRLPTDVAVAPGGTLYVVDFGHKRIVRLRPAEGAGPRP